MARKRNAGEGSIFHRKDGRWCGQINLGYVNGKRRRRLVYGATAAAVREAMTKKLHERDQGMLPATASQTVAQFLESWLSSVKSSLRIRSFERYKSIVDKHLTPDIGRVKLDKLTPLSYPNDARLQASQRSSAAHRGGDAHRTRRRFETGHALANGRAKCGRAGRWPQGATS
jgi:hypothetical protein